MLLSATVPPHLHNSLQLFPILLQFEGQLLASFPNLSSRSLNREGAIFEREKIQNLDRSFGSSMLYCSPQAKQRADFQSMLHSCMPLTVLRSQSLSTIRSTLRIKPMPRQRDLGLATKHAVFTGFSLFRWQFGNWAVLSTAFHCHFQYISRWQFVCMTLDGSSSSIHLSRELM